MAMVEHQSAAGEIEVPFGQADDGVGRRPHRRARRRGDIDAEMGAARLAV